ncbi:amidase signature enzyme [Trametes gibbosa]|nr:amidase signature enzyme [Trametes gibbosa]
MSSFLAHRRDSARKHEQLRSNIARASALCARPSAHSSVASDASSAETVSEDEGARILTLSLSELAAACNDGSVIPSDVLHVYGRRALAAHEATNCLADIFLDEADPTAGSSTSGIPRILAGVPISIKDCIDVAGHDTTLGFSARVGHPAPADAPLVRLLRDAGALLYAKTALPTACLSFECSSDLFGTTTNPYNRAFSPGASTGGGAALLASQGSMVEVGTDIGGSVRYPAAYCGIYAVKGTHGRFPSTGCVSCVPGLESVPTITAPLARTLDDLQEFWRRVVEMRPWEYDHTCVPIPWRPVDHVASGKKLRFGVLADDGIVVPTPAAARALKEVASALRKQGHTVVEFSPPSPLEGLKVGYQLMFSDGAQSILAPKRVGEYVGPALLTVRLILRFPLWLKRLSATLLRWFSRPRGRNDAWAALMEIFHPRTAREERALVIERDKYRAAWFDAWREAGLDLMLTVPHALPAVPKEPAASDKTTLVSASSAFLYNVLDCAAGAMPVAYVDAAQDAHPPNYRRGAAYLGMNDVSRAIHDLYDASAMHGLPVGVQVVGGRFEEEHVLAGMKLIEHALRESERGFVPRKFQ